MWLWQWWWFIMFLFHSHKRQDALLLVFCFYFQFLYFPFVVFICPAHSFSLVPLHRSALWLVQPNCWWDAERQDCIPCRCSPHGSMSQRCDIEGRCICRPGFVGRRCDLRRQGYERRETRRPVERVPIEAVQQRWGGSSRTGGCPRGAYRPRTGVTHTAWCVLSSMGVFSCCVDVLDEEHISRVYQGLNSLWLWWFEALIFKPLHE